MKVPLDAKHESSYHVGHEQARRRLPRQNSRDALRRRFNAQRFAVGGRQHRIFSELDGDDDAGRHVGPALAEGAMRDAVALARHAVEPIAEAGSLSIVSVECAF